RERPWRSLRRCVLLRRETIFCLWAGECDDVSALGWGHGSAASGPSDSAVDVCHDRAIQADPLFRRAASVRGPNTSFGKVKARSLLNTLVCFSLRSVGRDHFSEMARADGYGHS